MPNIWHLTHQTPIFKFHEMFQISKFFIICLFTVSLSYIHSNSLSLFSHLEFLLYACHFFSLVEAADLADLAKATDIAANLAAAAYLTTPSSLSFFSSLILKPLKLPHLELPISPGVVSPRATDVSSLHLADLSLSLSLSLSFSWCLWQCL